MKITRTEIGEHSQSGRSSDILIMHAILTCIRQSRILRHSQRKKPAARTPRCTSAAGRRSTRPTSPKKNSDVTTHAQHAAPHAARRLIQQTLFSTPQRAKRALQLFLSNHDRSRARSAEITHLNRTFNVARRRPD
jgi:hypothetical protein